MKKRITLTESERESILNLHSNYKKRLLEQETTTTQATPASAPATTQDRWKTATCKGLNKKAACKDKILQTQIKINDKCPADKLTTKLVEDGIWGPKTGGAFTACGGPISGQDATTKPAPGSPGGGNVPIPGSTGGAAAGSTTGSAATGSTTGSAAAGSTGGTNVAQAPQEKSGVNSAEA